MAWEQPVTVKSADLVYAGFKTDLEYIAEGLGITISEVSTPSRLLI